MKNLEFKAKCHSLATLRQRLVDLKAEYRRTMKQIDTYFSVPKGRLKLREIDDREACLVYYERPDISESRYSNYQICDISDMTAFRQLMSMALGVKVVVEKRRELWMFGNTRIHLDQVVDLGEFVELETVIRDQTEAEAQTEHQRVKDALGIRPQDLVSASYAELI
ncbi:MAG: class IV adenylate cyclase [Candidatus Poribacteria bacterium]|nr:class IV adenylate cyclase [Candidatus Poribacteria bacterium]